MKLHTLVNEDFIKALSKLLDTGDLPIKTAFKVSGILKQVNSEVNKYEDVRRAALQKHGTKNEDGSLVADDKGNIKMDEESLKAFVLEMNELHSLDVDVPSLTLAELGDNLKISVREAQLLSVLIKE